MLKDGARAHDAATRLAQRSRRFAKMDRRVLYRFVGLAKPYWLSKERRAAWGLLALLVLLLLGETEFNVLFNQQSGELSSALAARDAPRFWAAIRLFFGLLGFAVPVYAFYYFVRDTLGIRWRRWLTHHFLGRYFGHRAFYELASGSEIDNPDQRIAEDIAAFTQKSLSFLFILLSSLFQLVAFSRVLWSISRPLVYFLVAYALAGTLVTFGVFGRRMILLNFLQLKREADFRFGLVRARENAESIAFYRGESEENRQLKQRFGALFQNFNALIRWTLKLNLFQYGYGLMTLALPSVIVAPRVLSGELEVGRVVQAAGAFSAILGALTLFVDNFESLSRFAAGIERLHAFRRAVSRGERRPPENRRIRVLDAEHLELEGVTVETPGHERTLVRELSLVVRPGQSLIIVGPSGGGKSSLLRAMAGLWEAGSGTIRRPRLDTLLFLPQHAYMVLGTLRDQLTYPRHGRDASDAELRTLLRRVNLPELERRCGGFDVTIDFDKVLSAGERQRVAVARLLVAAPKYAVLDEATSALDAENEAALYAEIAATGTTLVSVSHRPALLKYHRQVLELRNGGSWLVCPVDAYRLDGAA
jgi:putative ATP-binding cassette transporter